MLGRAPAPPPCTPSRFTHFKEYEYQPLAQLVLPSIASFVIATLMRMLLMRLALHPLCELAVGPGEGRAKDRQKFREAAWRALLYTVACAWAILSVLNTEDHEWLYDSSHFWVAWPNHVTTPEMASVYAVYIGFYVHHSIFLVLDTRSSDFLALAAHHAITLTVTLFSWVMHFTRIGCFVMVLHDVSDIFLEIAKCFNYSQKEHPRLSVGADVSFIIFALSFFFLRLLVFPYRVVYSTFVEVRAGMRACDSAARALRARGARACVRVPPPAERAVPARASPSRARTWAAKRRTTRCSSAGRRAPSRPSPRCSAASSCYSSSGGGRWWASSRRC